LHLPKISFWSFPLLFYVLACFHKFSMSSSLNRPPPPPPMQMRSPKNRPCVGECMTNRAEHKVTSVNEIAGAMSLFPSTDLNFYISSYPAVFMPDMTARPIYTSCRV
jgi:hypothetical protein